MIVSATVEEDVETADLKFGIDFELGCPGLRPMLRFGIP